MYIYIHTNTRAHISIIHIYTCIHAFIFDYVYLYIDHAAEVKKDGQPLRYTYICIYTYIWYIFISTYIHLYLILYIYVYFSQLSTRRMRQLLRYTCICIYTYIWYTFICIHMYFYVIMYWSCSWALEWCRGYAAEEYMYVCIHVCMHMYIHLYMIYIYMLCTYIHICICLYSCIDHAAEDTQDAVSNCWGAHVYVHTRIHVYVHTHQYDMYLCVYKWIHIYMFIHIFIFVDVYSCIDDAIEDIKDGAAAEVYTYICEHVGDKMLSSRFWKVCYKNMLGSKFSCELTSSICINLGQE